MQLELVRDNSPPIAKDSISTFHPRERPPPPRTRKKIIYTLTSISLPPNHQGPKKTPKLSNLMIIIHLTQEAKLNCPLLLERWMMIITSHLLIFFLLLKVHSHPSPLRIQKILCGCRWRELEGEVFPPFILHQLDWICRDPLFPPMPPINHLIWKNLQ